MKQLVLSNIADLHLVFRAYRSHDGLAAWYRGQADSCWEPLPKAGRPEFLLPDNRDLGRFNAWCQVAVAFGELPTRAIERLAVAQHHGLATRLLDWTSNPLVATYFACAESELADGAIYILETPDQIFTEDADIKMLTAQQGVFGYMPKPIAPRVLNQKGLFTVHCDAAQAISIKKSRFVADEFNLNRVVIPAALKSELLAMLNDYGINRSSLFPDFDGLSSHLNVQTLEMVRRENAKKKRALA